MINRGVQKWIITISFSIAGGFVYENGKCVSKLPMKLVTVVIVQML